MSHLGASNSVLLTGRSSRSQQAQGRRLKVLTLNTWLGGTSVDDGFQKIVKHIKEIDADIVGLQEVPNERWMSELAEALGSPWEAVAHSASYADTGIVTKHKLSLANNSFEVTWGMGVGVELDNSTQVNFVCLHLNYHSYGPYAANNKLVTSAKQILQGEKSADGTSRQQNIEELLASLGFQAMLNATKDVPLIVVGDFNCPSHEDWTEETKDEHGGWAFEWPATKLIIEKACMVDTFREVHPNVTEVPGHTWSTVQKGSGAEWDYTIPEPQDRIDFIYYRAATSEGVGTIRPLECDVYAGTADLRPIPNHKANDWPSDHFGVYAVYEIGGKGV